MAGFEGAAFFGILALDILRHLKRPLFINILYESLGKAQKLRRNSSKHSFK